MRFSESCGEKFRACIFAKNLTFNFFGKFAENFAILRKFQFSAPYQSISYL